MIPFNYHHLYYFYVIAEEGSVTLAAKKLRVSQSSLSMQLAQFESFLEKKLFLREGKKLSLTEDGNHILTYAKAIFDLGEELADSLDDRPRAGVLKIQIGVSGVIPKTFVDQVLNHLFSFKEIPYVNLEERGIEDMLKDLSAHKLDMVLNDLPFQSTAQEGVENHLVAKIPLALCANKQWAKKIRRIPQDLTGIPMILPTAQSQTYHGLQEYFLSHKVKPRVIAEIEDLELVRRLVLSGQGVAPINTLTISKAPAKEKLEILGKPGQLGIFDLIYLIRKKRKITHPLVDELLSHFKV